MILGYFCLYVSLFVFSATGLLVYFIHSDMQWSMLVSSTYCNSFSLLNEVPSVNIRTQYTGFFLSFFFFSWSLPVNKCTLPLTSDKQQSFMEQWMDRLSKSGSAAAILGYGLLWTLDPSYLMCCLAPWLIFKSVFNCAEATCAFGQTNHMSRCEVTRTRYINEVFGIRFSCSLC